MGPTARLLTAATALMAALYCGLDPWGQSSMSAFPGFATYAVDAPPWHAVPRDRDRRDRLRAAEVRFRGQLQGPESIAFDRYGRGPYTGVADGRVVFWDGAAWKDFAYTSPNRSEICNHKPTLAENEHICGRPLGLRFNAKKPGELYIADAYFGLLKVGPEGGLATPVATEAEGVRFKFTNDLDIDDEGNVYFTDSSFNYQRRDYMQLVFTADPSGRLLKYNADRMETTVLLSNLQFPNGVSLSKDGSFFVFSEGSLGRLSRYWLKGDKAGTSEPFAILPGFPDNVRTNGQGDFWVAMHCRHTRLGHFLALHPRLRKVLLKLPIPARTIHRLRSGGKSQAVVAKYSQDGKLLAILEDSRGEVVRAVSEVVERDGELWLGSVLMPFIAVYTYKYQEEVVQDEGANC